MQTLIRIGGPDRWSTSQMRLLLGSIMMMISVLSISAQSPVTQSEPEFIGEAYFLKSDGSQMPLNKEIGDFTSGMSWSSNSWNALSLEVAGGKAGSRVSAAEPLQLVIRAADNNSDPLSIVSIYKFKAKKKSRSVLISKDNSGTFLKSRTNSKDMVRFSGKKFGGSSYLIVLSGLSPGEYGVVVSNPNSRDEKRVIVSCFAVD